jgi:hypothetical protein
MGEIGQRQIARDSLFVMAELRFDGIEGEQRVRVRNLSTGGLMAETNQRVLRGQLVWVKLRNIGWIEASVAWVQDGRVGIAFREEIDPKLPRSPEPAVEEPELMVRRPLYVSPAQPQPAGKLRKL